MPKMAQRMDHDLHHPLAQHQKRRPRRRCQADDARPPRRCQRSYPDLGAVLARELGQIHSQVPDYVSFYSATEGRMMAPGSGGFLGQRYEPMYLTAGNVPENLRRLDEISELDHLERAELRDFLSKRFERGRSSRALGSHNVAYERVRGLMASESLFDIKREPQSVRDQFGPTQFGEQVLIARRLIEAGRAIRARCAVPGGIATARTSRPTRKWSPSSTTSWPRCSMTSTRAACSRIRW